MLKYRYTVGRLTRTMELFFAKTRFQESLPVSYQHEYSATQNSHATYALSLHLPYATPSFSLQYPCFQDLSLIHVSVLSFLAISPWIMPSHLLTESCLRKGSKSSQQSSAMPLYCIAQSTSLERRNPSHIPLCKLSLSHSCCNNLHLNSQP